jgi:signal transduction histidine kinase
LEVVETARAFNTMQRRISRFVEDRARILAAVSHDLKTPLTRIRLRADLLEDEVLGAKIRRDLDDMQRMVDATLDFMRGTESREETRPLDLMALLESLCDDAAEAGQQVVLRGRVVTPYHGRPLALKRCIGNLLDNALRYGGSAEVSVRDSDKGVTLSVADQGPGIPEGAMGKVFEPFFRLEASRARRSGGTGLGLGIARNIARAHGGDLVLKHRPGGGLIAELRLPR